MKMRFALVALAITTLGGVLFFGVMKPKAQYRPLCSQEATTGLPEELRTWIAQGETALSKERFEALDQGTSLVTLFRERLVDHPPSRLAQEMALLLGHCNPVVIRATLYAAGEFSLIFPETLGHVTAFLNHPDREIRINAVVASAKFGPILVPLGTSFAFMEMLRNEDDQGIMNALRHGIRNIGLALAPYAERNDEVKRLISPVSTALERKKSSRFERPAAEKGDFLVAFAEQEVAKGACGLEASRQGYTPARALEEMALLQGDLPIKSTKILSQYLLLRPETACAFDETIEALASSPSTAREAAPALAKLLTETTSHRRRLAAALALAELGPNGERELSTLALRNDLTLIPRMAAIRGLEHAYTVSAWATIKQFWKSVASTLPYPYRDEAFLQGIFGPFRAAAISSDR